MLARLLALLRGQWMGALALFLVLTGGVAYAANTVFSSDIVNGEVKTLDLANNAVTSGKIGNRQVGPADLAAPEPWHEVGPGSATSDRCATVSGFFCSDFHAGSSSYIQWRNWGADHSHVAFYEDQLGIVHLKGLAQNYYVVGDVPVIRPIFRLPPAYRPDFRRVFASVGQEGGQGQDIAQARVDVLANGLVELLTDCSNADVCSGSGGYVTLDGIAFRPDE